jgi:hypothetical protein
LLVEKKLRDELMLFTVDEQNSVLADNHRGSLMLILIRLFSLQFKYLANSYPSSGCSMAPYESMSLSEERRDAWRYIGFFLVANPMNSVYFFVSFSSLFCHLYHLVFYDTFDHLN